MEVYIEKLKSIVEDMPQYNSALGVKKLHEVFSLYRSVLHSISSLSEDHKRCIHDFLLEIDSIEHDISLAATAKSAKERDMAFNDAVRGLRIDIEDLISLSLNWSK
jgi:hypothetical protein